MRLIAIDIDDTLIDPQRQIPLETKEAIAWVRSLGVTVTLATGRIFPSALPYVNELRLDTPIISSNGGDIRWPDGRYLKGWAMETESLIRILSYFREKGIHTNLYTAGELYVESLTPEAIEYQEIAGLKAQVVGSLERYIQEHPVEYLKVLAIADPEVLARLRQEAEEVAGPGVYVTPSKPFYLEFASGETSKGRALAYLADYLGVQPQEVMAIGDSGNDIPMLEWAGVGVAVPDAQSQALAVADRVATVAQAIRGIRG